MGLFRSLLLVLPLALAACSPPPPKVGADGLPLPQVYTIRPSDEGRIQFGMLDSVNALRRAAGVQELSLNADLVSAAATHARDVAVQNRAWNFGSDGSSGLDRVARTGYPGGFVGEAISESYESELETLAAWMGTDKTRPIVLDPKAEDMGFAWFQEKSGKIWWVMVTGASTPVTDTALVN